MSSNAPINAQASKDGNEFHEAWAARVALGLLIPNTQLTSISLEGFSPAESVGKGASEIADLVKYYQGRNEGDEERIEVVQFKYSPSNPDGPLSASDLSGTLEKFMDAQTEFERSKGANWIVNNLQFEFTTNRPIGENLAKAIVSLQRLQPTIGHVKTQADTLLKCLGNDPAAASDFLSRLTILGRGSTLSGLKQEARKTISSWYGASGARSRLSFSALCALIREKVGMQGVGRNAITKIDVLGSFDIHDVDDLFPIAAAFPHVPSVLERDCFDEIEKRVRNASLPFLIHGPGGSGKTVVMQALARRLSNSGKVVLFDGFGGGQWRMPDDSRHQCRRSLLHIVNELAGNGLCDLMLPGEDDESALRTARKRLEQAVESLRLSDKSAQVFLLLDAVDHAGIQAKSKHEQSFAELLVQSLELKPITGVTLVASCRTERRKDAIGDSAIDDIPLPPFDLAETSQFLERIDSSITPQESHAIHKRSHGNPRCVDALVKVGRPFDIGGPISGTSEISTSEILDELLLEQFKTAIASAVSRGSSKQRVLQLLHAVALLPPPVPVEELSNAFGVSISEVESFFYDLFPLIENSNYGLIFRDEPTETLAIKIANEATSTLDAVLARLENRQAISEYATRALPHLLLHHKRIENLVSLAYSDAFPSKLSSSVAMRGIRLSRLSAAAIGCATTHRTDELFSVVVEAARVAGGSERADKLVFDFPDLVAASGDTEALRRLFEYRGVWAGARFSAMAIANFFSGESNEADRNARKAIDWLNWSLSQPREEHYIQGVPNEREWVRALCLFLLKGDLDALVVWLNKRDPHEAFRLFAKTLETIQRGDKFDDRVKRTSQAIIRKAKAKRKQPVWYYAAVLKHVECDLQERVSILTNLARDIQAVSDAKNDSWENRNTDDLVDALLGAGVMAAHAGMLSEAGCILNSVPIERPGYYDYEESHLYRRKVSKWIVFSALKATCLRRKPSFSDIVPSEIWKHIPQSVKRRGPKAVEARCTALLNTATKKKPKFEYESRERIGRVISKRSTKVLRLIEISQRLVKSGDNEDFLQALETAISLTSSSESYPYRDQASFVSDHAIGTIFEIADILDLWQLPSAEAAVDWVQEAPGKTYDRLIRLTKALSRSSKTHAAALTLAEHASEFIKKDEQAETRIHQLSLLARAVWNVSSDEAGLRFCEALELADGLGSDNQDQIQAFSALLSRYKGPEFPQKTIHDYSRMRELSLPYDTDKFDWITLSKSLACIGSFNAIAILTRFTDRDRGALSWTIRPFFAFLVERKRMRPTLASALFGLDENVEMWHWGLAQFAEHVAPELSAEHSSLLLNWILIEFDRRSKASISAETLQKLSNVFGKVCVNDPSYIRLQTLLTATSSSKDQPTSAIPKSEPRIPEIDLASVAALDNALLEEGTNKQNTKRLHVADFARHGRNVHDATTIIDTIVRSEIAELYDKLLALEVLAEQWSKSVAVKERLSKAVLELIDLQGDELVGPEWPVGTVFQKLMKLNSQGGDTVVAKLVLSQRGGLDLLSSEDWLRCAYWMADKVTPDTIQQASGRFIHLSVSAIPEDIGDSIWDSTFESPTEESTIAAGLIWHQLGSPHAAIRWRAAHAVRRIMAIGEFTVLSKLMDRYHSTQSFPFGDKKLPFYHFYAKLWLLLALDRISIDGANHLVPLVPNLKKALIIEPHHALLRATAYSVLVNIADETADSHLTAFLSEVQKSLEPIGLRSEKDASGRRNSYQGRPDGNPRPADDLFLDYDFEKYDVNRLGSMFGVDTWQVRDGLSSQVREWEKSLKSMYDCPQGVNRNTYGSGRDFHSDGFGYYLANNALQILAAKYLETLPLVQGRWEDDTWDSWLRRYALPNVSFWASDATDPFPHDLPNVDVDTTDPKRKNSTKDSLSLASLISPKIESSTEDKLLINARWEQNEGGSVNISSVLVGKEYAADFATALALIDPLYQYIPTIQDEDDDTFRGSLGKILSPLLVEPEYGVERLDEGDPYGSTTVLQRARPSPCFQQMLGPLSQRDFGRIWSNKKGLDILQLECWGASFGAGQHAHAEYGDRVTMPKSVLVEALQKNSKSVVFLVKVKRYLKDSVRSYEGKSARRSAVVILDEAGHLRPVVRISRKIRAAHRSLDDYAQTELERCYNTVRTATNLSP